MGQYVFVRLIRHDKDYYATLTDGRIEPKWRVFMRNGESVSVYRCEVTPNIPTVKRLAEKLISEGRLRNCIGYCLLPQDALQQMVNDTVNKFLETVSLQFRVSIGPDRKTNKTDIFEHYNIYTDCGDKDTEKTIARQLVTTAGIETIRF